MGTVRLKFLRSGTTFRIKAKCGPGSRCQGERVVTSSCNAASGRFCYRGTVVVPRCGLRSEGFIASASSVQGKPTDRCKEQHECGEPRFGQHRHGDRVAHREHDGGGRATAWARIEDCY